MQLRVGRRNGDWGCQHCLFLVNNCHVIHKEKTATINPGHERRITKNGKRVQVFRNNIWLYSHMGKSHQENERKMSDPPSAVENHHKQAGSPSGICLPGTELLQSPFRTELGLGSRSRRYRRFLRCHRRFLRSWSLRRFRDRRPPMRRRRSLRDTLNIIKHC